MRFDGSVGEGRRHLRREETRAEVAGQFLVNGSWIRVLQRRREMGAIEPKPGEGPPPGFSGESADRLRVAVGSATDATMEELVAVVGVSCSTSATKRALRGLRLTRKKHRFGPLSRTGLI
jgi:hypothetical protein